MGEGGRAGRQRRRSAAAAGISRRLDRSASRTSCFAMTEDYPVPASGTIDYKYFEVPTNFTEDRWIQAYEVKPGTPSVVHHVIVYAQAAAPRAGGRAPQGAARGQRRARDVKRRSPSHRTWNEPEAVKRRGARQTDAERSARARSAASARSSAGSPRARRARVFTRRARRSRCPPGRRWSSRCTTPRTARRRSTARRIGLVFAKEPPKQEVDHGGARQRQLHAARRRAEHARRRRR